MRYIATFFSHFGAIRFSRMCREAQVAFELAPVPRSLSSSCGTCALFEVSPLAEGQPWPDEVERVARVLGEGATASFEEIYRAEGL